MKKLIIIFFLFWTVPICLATTYYVDGSESDDTGTGLVGSPKKYISSGIGLMSSGDTLIIADGTYTGAANMIGEEGSPANYPPSGSYGVDETPMTSDDVYTTIQAETVGGVIIDAEYNCIAFYNNNAFRNYLKIDGIHFKNGDSGVFGIYGDYNKVTRCGFQNGMAPASNIEAPVVALGGGSSYSLFEDCYVWGKGRYGLYGTSTDGGTDHCIFRRCLVRLDESPTSYVSSGIRFYNGDTNIAQNCIVIDSTPNSESVNQGCFATGGNSSDGDNNHIFIGCIALNNDYWSGMFPESLDHTLTIQQSIFWDTGSFGIAVAASSDDVGTDVALDVDHCTVGVSGYSGIRSNTGYSVTEDADNCISVNNGTYGVENWDSASYINTYGNTDGGSLGVTISNGITTNPIGTSLKYLVRIEDGSTLDGAASDNGDIGATILKKIGTDGTLYGQTGYNTTTDDDLWPWPNEDLIKTKLAADSARGFCAGTSEDGSSQTLTKYIWEYLGNQIPADIYGSETPAATVQCSGSFSGG